MTKKVIFADPEMKVTEVAAVLFKNRFHGMPVVEKGKVIGIITEDDFYIKDIENLFLPSYIGFLKGTKVAYGLPKDEKKKIKKLLNATARDVMTRKCLTVFPDMEVGELLNVIKKTKFNTLPVTDKDKNILGVVTLMDVLGLLNRNQKINNLNKALEIGSAREVDKMTQEVHSFWGKTFVFIRRTRVRTWKMVFVVAFISGAAAALIWTVSIKIQTSSDAAGNMANVKLRSDDTIVKKGDIFNVDIILDTNENYAVYSKVTVNYNPEDFKLEIWDTDDSIFSSDKSCAYDDNPCETVEKDEARGKITISLANPKRPIKTSSGKVFNLVFRTLRETSGEAPNIILGPVSLKGYDKSGVIFSGFKEMDIPSSFSNTAIEVVLYK